MRKNIFSFSKFKTVLSDMTASEIEKSYIPGLLDVSIFSDEDVIKIITSSGHTFTMYPEMDFEAFSANDMLNTHSNFLVGLKDLYDRLMSTRYLADVEKKAKIIVDCNKYELFDETDDIFSKDEEKIFMYNLTIEDLEKLNDFAIYDKNSYDKLAPNVKSNLILYLNDKIEYAIVKIFLFLKANDVIRTQIKTENQINVFDIKNILRILNEKLYGMADSLGIKLLGPFDYTSKKEVQFNSDYVCYLITNTDFVIKIDLNKIKKEKKIGSFLLEKINIPNSMFEYNFNDLEELKKYLEEKK